MHEKDPFDNLPHELLRTGEGVSVEVDKWVKEEDRPLLWDMIQTGFTDLNNHSHERQDMTYEEFLADIESPDVLKYVARDRHDRPIGYLTVHIGLDGVTWTDTDPLAEAQAEVDPAASPFYIGTLVVPKDKRGTEAATRLLQGAILHFRDTNQRSGHESLCLFDCAHQNHPWLAEFIEKVSRQATEDFEGVPVEITEVFKDQIKRVAESAGEPYGQRVAPQTPDEDVVGVQHYYAVKML